MAKATPEWPGEYWLIDGQPVDADREGCGLGHADVVVQHVWRHSILPALRLMGQNKAAFWDDLADILQRFITRNAIDVIECREQLLNWSDALEKVGSITAEQGDDIEQFMRESSIDSTGCQRLTPEMTAIAFGSCREEDFEMVRNYGRRHLGWIRVTGNNVDMWEATPEQLVTAADGLRRIFRKDVGRMTFLFQTIGDGRFYLGVPWRVFKYGDPLELVQYASKVRARIPTSPRSVYTLPS